MRLPPIRIRTRLETGPLAALYGEQEPEIFSGPGTREEPLTTVGVFEAAPQEAPRHWHYVGFGLRDRFALELTFRLVRVARGEGPVGAPAWPVGLLQRFARHVVESGVGFEEGHYLCLPTPVDPGGRLRCAALVKDPELGASELPAYYQVVALHERELPSMADDGWKELIARLRAATPLFVTRPDRAPLPA